MIIRPAMRGDADGVAAVLEALVRAGKRRKPSDAEFSLSHYIEHRDRLQCHVAVGDKGEILGFQSLKRAFAGNIYGTPPGWGIIGTHIRPDSARQGVGTALFEATLKAAQISGIPAIEALIAASNGEGQAYYDAMGFRDDRHVEGAICKSLKVK